MNELDVLIAINDKLPNINNFDDTAILSVLNDIIIHINILTIFVIMIFFYNFVRLKMWGDN